MNSENPISEASSWIAGVITTALAFIGAVGSWIWRLSSKLAKLEQMQVTTAEHVEELDRKYESMKELVVRTDQNVIQIKELLQPVQHPHPRRPSR